MQTGSNILCEIKSDAIAAHFNNIPLSYFKCDLQKKKTLGLWERRGGVPLLSLLSVLLLFVGVL